MTSSMPGTTTTRTTGTMALSNLENGMNMVGKMLDGTKMEKFQKQTNLMRRSTATRPRSSSRAKEKAMVADLP